MDGREVEPSCDLCEAERKTKWYHSDAVCWVAVCNNCGGDMIVYNFHNEPSESEKDHMWEVTQEIFPGKEWRGYRRSILDHWHEHIV